MDTPFWNPDDEQEEVADDSIEADDEEVEDIDEMAQEVYNAI